MVNIGEYTSHMGLYVVLCWQSLQGGPRKTSYKSSVITSVTPFIRPFVGVITPRKTGRGPTL